MSNTDFSLPVITVTDIVISGTTYKLPVFQTGKTVKVKNIATTTEYTGAEEGTSGIYKFTGIPNGKYHKLVDGVQSGTFGVTNGRFIADDNLPYAKLNAENTFTATQGITGGNLVVTGTGSFGGNLSSGGDLTVVGAINAGDNIYTPENISALEAFMSADGAPFTTNTPTALNSLVCYKWVAAQIASIVVTPFQESNNKVRCIPNGVIETNKVYRSPKQCADSFVSPSATNQCMVEITGAGNAAEYLNINLNTLKSYVHFVGLGKHCKVIMRDGATNTKTMNWERLTIIFGAIDFTGDREYNGMTFEDCDIFAYKNTTFTNCNLIRCRILHASSYRAILKGNTRVEMCGFNNEPDKSLLSGGYEVSGGYSIYYPSLPSDPSTVEIPGGE